MEDKPMASMPKVQIVRNGRLELKKKHPHAKLTPEHESSISVLRRHGFKWREIADFFGVSIRSVQRAKYRNDKLEAFKQNDIREFKLQNPNFPANEHYALSDNKPKDVTALVANYNGILLAYEQTLACALKAADELSDSTAGLRNQHGPDTCAFLRAVRKQRAIECEFTRRLNNNVSSPESTI